MFPFAIINNFGSKIERIYRQFAGKVNKEIFPMLRDTGKDRSRPVHTGIIYDAANVLELLEEIRLNYGDYVDQKTLDKIISENLNLLDGWSTSQLNTMINQQNATINVGGIDKPVVFLIPRKDAVTMANIPLANNTQRLLQNDAYSKYFFDVEDIINKGIINGTTTDEITKQILDKVDMNAKRARFWAEDQAAMFQAEQTRIKAMRSGETHYKWICQGNARPSHAVHNGQIISWNVGVNNLSRPGARHPGEDYRCHCTVGLVTAQEVIDRGLSNPPPREPQSTEGLRENYKGSEATKAAKGMTDQWAKQNLMSNYSPYEIDALTAWQSGYYKSIVAYLEGDVAGMTPGQKRTLESRIGFIDAAIDKSILPIELSVMSGIEDFAKLGVSYNDFQIGDFFDPERYIATSLSENLAKSFTDSSKVVLEIYLPKGSKGVYMNNLSKLKPHEKEILLQRNQKYIIVDKYEKAGYNYLKLEVKK